MENKKLLVYFSILLTADATMNICIPLNFSVPEVTASNPDAVLKDNTQDVTSELPVNKRKPDIEKSRVVINITHPAVNVHGDVTNVTIYNLLDFKICFLQNISVNSNYVHFDLFNLTFSNIRIEGQYNLTGDLGDLFDIFGNGPFWIEVINVSVTVVNLTLNITEEICTPVDVEFEIGALRNHFYHFMVDDETEDLLNRAISSIVPDAMKIIWKEWKEIFGKPLEKLINDILHDHNTVPVFNLLQIGNLPINNNSCYISTNS